MDFQRWLDDWADCVLAQDYDGFRANCVLPFEMITPTNHWKVEHEDVMRAAFGHYAQLLVDHGVTLIARSLTEVAHEAPGEVALHFHNHLMHGPERIMAPTRSTARLRQEGGSWRCFSIQEKPAETPAARPLPRVQIEELHRQALLECDGTEFGLNASKNRSQGEEND